MKEKVVLAYSGGLDTSFCLKYLVSEMNYEVYTAIANTGGFSDQELDLIEKKAYELGSSKHISLDITNTYYHKCIKYMVFGNVLRNNTYPMSVSSERTFQAIAIIEYAQQIGATYVAHGSTGAGNDQVRFDLTFQVLAPHIKIITPTRDLKLTRDEEIAFLKNKGINHDWHKMPYSINKGLWGTSIGGKETLKSNMSLPDNAYPTSLTSHEEKEIIIEFKKGELEVINGIAYSNPVDAIKELEKITAPFAIGRDMHVGDTIIGIKGRVAFEAAAPLIIIKSHQLLEKHTLSKWQLYWKEQLANWYGMFLHESLFLEPVMRDIEHFLDHTQESVTGKVIVLLKPYHFSLIGVESQFDLMKSDFGEYGEMNKAWSADDVKGFTKILGNSLRVYNSVNNQA